MDTAAFIISILSALTAIAAAVWAKQSADAAKRSAAAEERGADAAESTLAIEEKRAEAEGRAREEAQAPRIDAGEHFGTMWTLAQNRTKLVGFIDNLGPGVALLERVELGVHREPPRQF